MSRHQLALSRHAREESPAPKVKDMEAFLLGHPSAAEFTRQNRLERVKRLSTREGTLAHLLRQLITADDLKDCQAAIPSLVDRCARHGRNVKRKQIQVVLGQLLDEAGLRINE
jgi:hypothetical protein